jgi:DNA-binding transcriptional LysR family regulator
MSPSAELDWDDLRYFLRAVQAQTLAGAARAMGVEHTTIGRRLSALEHALGAPLVLRAPDGLRLTALGARLAPLVEQVERAVAEVRAVAADQRSRVRLAIPSGISRLFTSGRLAELRRDYPDLALEIVSGSRQVDLGKGEADLALRSGPIGDADLVVRKLCDSGFSLYASEAYLARHPGPADLDGLGGHEIIGFDPGLAALPAAQWIERHAARGAVVLRSREMTDMLQAAVAGLGIAALPCVLGDTEPALRRLTPAVIATRPVSLVYRREARLSAEVRAVIRFVVDVVRDNALLMSGA